MTGPVHPVTRLPSGEAPAGRSCGECWEAKGREFWNGVFCAAAQREESPGSWYIGSSPEVFPACDRFVDALLEEVVEALADDSANL